MISDFKAVNISLIPLQKWILSVAALGEKEAWSQDPQKNGAELCPVGPGQFHPTRLGLRGLPTLTARCRPGLFTASIMQQGHKSRRGGKQASHSSSTCYLGPLCPHPWGGLPLWRSSWGSASASARSAPGGTGWRRSWVHRACRGTLTRSGLRTQSASWFGCRSKPQRKGPGGLGPVLAHPPPPHSLGLSPFQSAEWEWPHDKAERCKQRPPWQEESAVTVWLWCGQQEGKTAHDWAGKWPREARGLFTDSHI